MAHNSTVAKALQVLVGHATTFDADSFCIYCNKM
jgi:hypothetical protein